MSLQIIPMKCRNKLQPSTSMGVGRYLRYRVPSEGLGFSGPMFLLWWREVFLPPDSFCGLMAFSGVGVLVVDTGVAIEGVVSWEGRYPVA